MKHDARAQGRVLLLLIVAAFVVIGLGMLFFTGSVSPIIEELTDDDEPESSGSGPILGWDSVQTATEQFKDGEISNETLEYTVEAVEKDYTLRDVATDYQDGTISDETLVFVVTHGSISSDGVFTLASPTDKPTRSYP